MTKNRINSSVKFAPKQKIKQIANSSQTQTLYTANLSDYTTEDDFYRLFGVRSTNYLKQNFSLKMPTNFNAILDMTKREVFQLNLSKKADKMG